MWRSPIAELDPVGIVLAEIHDPFLGGGTTGRVALALALALGRRFVGSNIDPDVVVLARRRIAEARASDPVDTRGAP